ncbi:endo-beta-N-acetylglucosaminidase [Spiroplasma endosymbiont of Diplazon laetatorius]|uniref:endo-beta-N-acetylglucosaminidase n=1 Tax=Spiroplasma endosymbiont of Diplazon laetatorius TaxID=3066322 RepID=UPI0030CA9292
MKKLLTLFMVTAVTTSSVITVSSCSIGETSTRPYISKLPDFDWSNGSTGYDLDFDPLNKEFVIEEDNFLDTNSIIQPNFVGKYFDYDTLTTNFKETPSLKKQATTGVPINKIYSSGNDWADFGVTSKARKGLKANTILNWNDGKDIDLKYGFANKELNHRTKTALKAVSTQDERISFADIRDHSRVNGSYQNTNIGTKNPFEKSVSNFQYRDYIFDWGQHGNIAPPAADMIDAAHTNGTPIYGLIFLSGYGGLQREDVKDFTRKNADGTYQLVDILIEMAITYGFDGWFFNDEANGGWPNGTITPANFSYDIIKQFNAKKNKSNDPKVKKLNIAYYRDSGTLKTLNNTPTFGDFARMSEYSDILQTDFRVKPNENKDYIKTNNVDSKKVHSLVELAGMYSFVGNFDWRQYIYGLDENNNDPTNPIYNKEIYQSVTSFSGAGGGQFGSEALEILNSNNSLKSKNYKSKVESFIYAQQVSNLYDNYIFSGLNGGLSEKDSGSISPLVQNPRNMIQADPRIDVGNQKLEDENDIFKNLYDFKNNGGYVSTSFGIGDVVQEYTIINDENFQDKNSIKTNFSLGNGSYFYERNANGKITSKLEGYPWTNRRFTDLAQTYNFDIKKDKKNLPIDQGINGFYDYYEPYVKGNSLSIGSILNMDGSISEANWKSGSYDWNIMGSNLEKGNYSLSFNVKTSNENLNIENDLKILTTYTKDGVNEQTEYYTPKVKELSDGWYNISTEISATENKKIAKMGIQINPKIDAKFKFNVGEFNIEKEKLEKENTVVSDINSEAVIKRDDQTINVRMNWRSNQNKSDYYEIYYKYDDKWFRVGESSIESFYVANLKYESDIVQFGIKPVNSGNDNQKIQTFKLKI